MGTLNLEDEKDISDFIIGMLDRRGLYLKKNDEWEVHGPHPDMNYQVYIGPAYRKKPKECFLVAVYPKAVYGIEDYSDWWKTDPKYRINISGIAEKIIGKFFYEHSERNIEDLKIEDLRLRDYFRNILKEFKEIRRRLQEELKDKNLPRQRKEEVLYQLWKLKSWIKAMRYDEFKERQRKQKEEKSLRKA